MLTEKGLKLHGDPAELYKPRYTMSSQGVLVFVLHCSAESFCELYLLSLEEVMKAAVCCL